eukprot:CAMPEP_0174252294 /NCGR_PEP_ID=MMETSP0439-20130205/1828_1 /TAXON_ID=0 /ORGANISM="Stereomyxa ramosa, Strain Chinc5" /LENGTH=744 /DNA_ID=CAMNT_0015332811 /DNA_START=33 /DNA_END=2267 /DNA_ORIENTATION=+
MAYPYPSYPGYAYPSYPVPYPPSGRGYTPTPVTTPKTTAVGVVAPPTAPYRTPTYPTPSPYTTAPATPSPAFPSAYSVPTRTPGTVPRPPSSTASAYGTPQPFSTTPRPKPPVPPPTSTASPVASASASASAQGGTSAQSNAWNRPMDKEQRKLMELKSQLSRRRKGLQTWENNLKQREKILQRKEDALNEQEKWLKMKADYQERSSMGPPPQVPMPMQNQPRPNQNMPMPPGPNMAMRREPPMRGPPPRRVILRDGPPPRRIFSKYHDDRPPYRHGDIPPPRHFPNKKLVLRDNRKRKRPEDIKPTAPSISKKDKNLAKKVRKRLKANGSEPLTEEDKITLRNDLRALIKRGVDSFQQPDDFIIVQKLRQEYGKVYQEWPPRSCDFAFLDCLVELEKEPGCRWKLTIFRYNYVIALIGAPIDHPFVTSEDPSVSIIDDVKSGALYIRSIEHNILNWSYIAAISFTLKFLGTKGGWTNSLDELVKWLKDQPKMDVIAWLLQLAVATLESKAAKYKHKYNLAVKIISIGSTHFLDRVTQDHIDLATTMKQKYCSGNVSQWFNEVLSFEINVLIGLEKREEVYNEREGKKVLKGDKTKTTEGDGKDDGDNDDNSNDGDDDNSNDDPNDDENSKDGDGDNPNDDSNPDNGDDNGDAEGGNPNDGGDENDNPNDDSNYGENSNGGDNYDGGADGGDVDGVGEQQQAPDTNFEMKTEAKAEMDLDSNQTPNTKFEIKTETNTETDASGL